MEDLHWPLTVLSRAVYFKNLTKASENIGLSQPQLSRIVSKLEEELSVTLLVRESRRKSGWTKQAHELGELYSAKSNQLQKSIENLLVDSFPRTLSVGVLEGLIPVGNRLANFALNELKINQVDLSVYDLSDLEEQYGRGRIDLMITPFLSASNNPKYNFQLGYQSLEKELQGDSELQVLSSFEFAQLKKKGNKPKLVSNSLAVRRNYLEQYGGKTTFPSRLKKTKPRGGFPVYLIGAEHINVRLWQEVKDHLKSQLKL